MAVLTSGGPARALCLELRPWGEDVFAQARRERRLVLVEVIRRACPRCRAVESAAFEPPQLRELLAGRFLGAGLDPDEYPDVAEAYADALVLLKEARPAPDPGLPFAVVVTPDGRPLDGTSLVRDGRALGPGLLALLGPLAREFEQHPEAAEARAGSLTAALREAQAPSPARSAALDPGLVDIALKGLTEAFDSRHGGFGSAPKRVPHGALRLLFAEHLRSANPRALAMAVSTLDAIVGGALRDAALGGFFREAAGEDFSLPVREKTLADNALLLRALLLGYEASGADRYRLAAVAIAEWATGRMRLPAGDGFRMALAFGDGTEERDDRLFTFANGLMIGALAKSAQALGRPADLAAAVEVATGLLPRVLSPIALARFVDGAGVHGPALLEDHVALAGGLLDLYEATSSPRWRDAGRSLVDTALLRFADVTGGGFFLAPEDASPRPARLRHAYDGLRPSANAELASLLLRLSRLTGETRYAELARRTALAFAADLGRAPRGMETLAAVVCELLGRKPEPSPAARLQARARLGPVSVAVSVVPPRLRPGQPAEARVLLAIAPGHVVVAHRPAGPDAPREALSDLVGLAVGLPGASLALRAPRYPEGRPFVRPQSSTKILVHAGEAAVTIPLLAPAAAGGAVERLRVRVLFQACDARGCAAPESVLLEASYEVVAPERASASRPGAPGAGITDFSVVQPSRSDNSVDRMHEPTYCPRAGRQAGPGPNLRWHTFSSDGWRYPTELSLGDPKPRHRAVTPSGLSAVGWRAQASVPEAGTPLASHRCDANADQSRQDREPLPGGLDSSCPAAASFLAARGLEPPAPPPSPNGPPPVAAVTGFADVGYDYNFDKVSPIPRSFGVQHSTLPRSTRSVEQADLSRLGAGGNGTREGSEDPDRRGAYGFGGTIGSPRARAHDPALRFSLPEGGGMTPSDVLKLAKEKGAKIVDLRFIDMPGLWQHFSIPAAELTEALFKEGIGFDGSSIRGFQAINESDMLLFPDPSTGVMDPFTAVPTLVLICDVKDPVTGANYGRDPRFIAKKAEAYVKTTGIADTIYIGPELEFFIFDDVRFDQGYNFGFYHLDAEAGTWNSGRVGTPERPNLGYRPRYKQGYFPVAPADHHQDLRSEMVLNLEAVGVKIEVHHHEVGSAGQSEIDMRFDTLTKMADKVLWYKYCTKNTARKFGKTVTFMPKPIFQDNGSGMHTHQSLWKGGKNLFYQKGGYADISEACKHYIGGILKHAPALCALIAPSTNSYRRLVPGYEAPINLAYSARNRSAAVRIPMYSSSEGAKRLEFRTPDPTCNPYLSFAACVMAGLDGIQNKIDPGPPLDKDLYELPAEEAAQVKQLPGSLEVVLDNLERDHAFLLKGDVFTRDFIETWIEYKRKHEVDAIRLRPHPWEFALYFDV